MLSRPIESIAELPFVAREPLELLGLREAVSQERDSPDDDYYVYGHARLDQLWLESDNADPVRVDNVMLLALHSADDAEELHDDVELEFFVDEIAEDYSVTVLLSKFLEVWLPQLCGDEANIVLALCNPHCAAIGISGDFDPGVAIHYPVGDASSWIEGSEATPRLSAERWLVYRR